MSDAPAEAPKSTHPPRPERSVSTRHETTIDGRTLAYTATVGTINLTDDKDAERASIFSVAYTLDGVDDPASRPVTFCFNGGPGSSSVWLQLGAFGPRRIDLPNAVAPKPPPHRLVDNPQGLLDRTDLVFIDPVGTGFSRPLGEAKAADFHAVKEDVESVGAFVRKWLTRNHRWNSPKLIAGESYGTTRAAALALHLADLGISCSGLVLVSLALDFQTFIFEPGNDLPNVLYLPSYAATAWYHHRLGTPPDDLHAFLDEVAAFAVDVYAPALLKGSRLDEVTKLRLAEQLAAYTGLDAGEIARRNLRIDYLWFAKSLLGTPGHTVGRLDSRYVGPDLDPHAQRASRDPSYDAPYAPYSAVINDFLRRELGWESDDDYEVLSMDVNEGWKWAQGDRMGYVHVAEDLRKALVTNPHLKVILANGYYDLATPWFAAQYTADHLDIDPSLRDNLTLAWYDAGHMMYLHPPSLVALRRDLAAFYDGLGD